MRGKSESLHKLAIFYLLQCAQCPPSPVARLTQATHPVCADASSISSCPRHTDPCQALMSALLSSGTGPHQFSPSYSRALVNAVAVRSALHYNP